METAGATQGSKSTMSTQNGSVRGVTGAKEREIHSLLFRAPEAKSPERTKSGAFSGKALNTDPNRTLGMSLNRYKNNYIKK